jgi:micrococcal nuclease
MAAWHIAPTILVLTALWTTGAADARKARTKVKGPVPVRVTKVVDGDTLVVVAQIWIDQRLRTRVRIHGIDAPERRGRCKAERDQARAAHKALGALLKGRRAVLREIRYGKYAGRVVAKVFNREGVDVGKALLKNGLVRAYRGRRRRSWC